MPMKFSNTIISFNTRPLDSKSSNNRTNNINHQKGYDFLRPIPATVPVSKIIKVYVHEQFKNSDTKKQPNCS